MTPDSFSDGGSFFSLDTALERAEELVRQGAAVIDVGGESTRPGAREVPIEEELERVIPVVRALASRLSVPISIDTTKSEVARAALSVGASIVNDISGMMADPAMAELLASSGAGLVLMHMRGDPRTMQTRTEYQDLLSEVSVELANMVERAIRAGVDPEKIAVDPGIGFAKTAEHSLLLLRRIDVLLELGYPVLVGPSRKSFIGATCGAPVGERLPGTIAALTAAVLGGARIVRVHDVAEAAQAVAVADAIRNAAGD